ncbi:MAG: hypothetical protein KUG75_13380 [Pseudomonadales bacterium]|nr:hypothetical protein [Pseudomonadales bacterium]
MRIFLKFIVLALIVATAAPFFLKGPDGKPIMSSDDFIPTTVIPANIDPNRIGNGDTIYKWKDEYGIWQFGEEPPEDFKAASVVLNDDAITPLESGWEGEQLEASNTAAPITVSPLSAYTQSKEMLDAAKSARDMGNKHNSDLQNILKEISNNK